MMTRESRYPFSLTPDEFLEIANKKIEEFASKNPLYGLTTCRMALVECGFDETEATQWLRSKFTL